MRHDQFEIVGADVLDPDAVDDVVADRGAVLSVLDDERYPRATVGVITTVDNLTLLQ
ncbi:hypothetical protein [Nocardia sp. NBC_00416]|uniref:hypothetical protein n=1 Tax=Nocardia sp. NBC_00416 TaxID=2975991 RepID=UPI002E1CDFA5